MSTAPSVPLVSLRDVTMSYGGVPALRGVSLRVSAAGVVHSLMGQNGCGKSTLLSILSGQIRPVGGEIRLDGMPVRFRDPPDALRHGIAMVSQETAVAEDLSVAENILLGRMVRTARGVDWAGSRRRAAEVLRELALDYDPRWTVRRLRPDQKQLVEIARAISLDSRLLILDEPTSTLTDDEIGDLFALLRRLTARGVSVLFVSHRLTEVFAISDELTVLRDGLTVSSGPAKGYTPESVVHDMVGPTDLRGEPAAGRDAARVRDDPVLTVRGLTAPNAFTDVSLDLRRGGVVGIAGLVGSGRSEFLEALFGVRAVSAGSVLLDGRDHTARSPRAVIAAGLGYVPPDRKTQGAVLPMSASDNLTMVATHRHGRLRVPRRRREGAVARRAADAVRLPPVSLPKPARALSGGNQQKVVLGKWIAAGPRVLLLDEPTRGVDVAAKAEIHTQLRRAAAHGLALLVTSSEIPELLDLCDEVLVMYRGRVVRRFEVATATETAVANAAAGGHP